MYVRPFGLGIHAWVIVTFMKFEIFMSEPIINKDTAVYLPVFTTVLTYKKVIEYTYMSQKHTPMTLYYNISDVTYMLKT